MVEKCHKLFTIEDIKTNVPVFSNNHALSILEIINEVINDINEHTLTDLAELGDLFESFYDDYPQDFALDTDALPE